MSEKRMHWDREMDNCEPIEDEAARLADEKVVGKHLPTPDEIAAECERLRARWSRKTLAEWTEIRNPRPLVRMPAMTIRRRTYKSSDD